jgi:paraquat-inducible protein A
MTVRTLTGMEAHVVGCDGCGLAHRASPTQHDLRCRRCGLPLHFRKPDSLNRTWALLIASYILIIPANLLPVMKSSGLSGTEDDTIMGGVIYLWESGSEVLGAILFIASIVIPLSKLFALTYLLISVRRRSTWNPKKRTQIYRILEAVGRWSMIDVYVASMLTALVQFGNLMSINVGGGAIAFGAVVVLTMIAAECFDPRLIWEATDQTQATPDLPKENHAV